VGKVGDEPQRDTGKKGERLKGEEGKGKPLESYLSKTV
jgi:hypothetical protein